MKSRSFFAKVNGARLKIETLGPQDAPAIIVHHGAPGLSSRLEPLESFGPFADSYRIVTFDARGSGESADDGPFTHEQWVADIEEIRQQLDLGKIVMAGGSYGGFMALEYTLAHPENVAALILRDTAANTDHDEAAKQIARSSNRSIDPWALDRIATGTFTSNAEFERYWRAILPLYEFDYLPETAEKVASSTIYHYQTHNYAFATNMGSYDLKPRLGEIACPVLVVVGRHDWRTPVAASQDIADNIPGSQMVVFEKSGHSPPLEEPERFQTLVRDFLQRAGVV